jgi:predicted AlkP superfamily phosphohydrolase/phosphomutase
VTRKVLVIGLDGATFSIIEPLIRDGRLPALRRLMEAGVRGVHQSTHLTNSPSAWSTFITGKNPGKHGIYGFFEASPQSYSVRFVNGSFRHGRSLWRIASDHRCTVGVVNVPMTYPAEPVNGYLLAGPDAPAKTSAGFSFPEGLVDTVEASTGPYTIEAGASSLVRQGRPARALAALRDSIRQRTEVAKLLLKRHDTDLFMVTFTEADRVQHHFWKYINPLHPAYSSPERPEFAHAIQTVYEALDEAVDEIIAAAGGDRTVVVLSDHGAGPSSHKTFFINRWLHGLGHLRYHSDGQGGTLLARSAENLVKRLYLYGRRALTKTWKRRLRRMLPGLKNRAHTTLLSGTRIDWAQTRAFSWENAPAIYINRKGQFPAGTVGDGREYEALREDLIAKLLALSCPVTGEPIVARVLRQEEMYWGPHAAKAPDLLIEWRNDAYTERPEYVNPGDGYTAVLDGKRLARAEIISRPSGLHRREGIFLAAGRDIRKGQDVGALELYDIPATILYLLGIDVPRDFDGRVLTAIFEPGYTEGHPVGYSDVDGDDETTSETTFSSEDADLIEKRLQGLGYIE